MLTVTSQPASIGPLALDQSARDWVARTMASLSTEEAVGQVFNLSTSLDSRDEVKELLALQPGGINRFPTTDLAAFRAATMAAIEGSKVPPIFSGDIEGGMISYPFATAVPNLMGIAAMDDLALTADVVRLVARESRALGYDWSFGPVVDINAEFRSAIVGTRSFGSDQARIAEQARTYVRVLQEEGVAACAKHWPGDGFDERDQHLVTSVNPLGMERWHETFGTLYKDLIDGGVMTVMSAHIALPAYIRSLHPEAGRDAFAPAALSRELNLDLLRGELGFDGLIVSDATGMGGMTGWMERSRAVPTVIESGCDMFLFSRNPVQDFQFMLQGLRTGLLSEQRLQDAVERILTLKAKLGLHLRKPDERILPLEELGDRLRSAAHQATAQEAAGRSVTLVKDTENLLPLDPQRHQRVVVIAEQGFSFWDGAIERGFEPFIAAMQKRGFEVRLYDPEAMPRPEDTDLVLYLVGQEATPSASRIFLDFAELHGGSRKGMTQFPREIPTALLSFGQPYYLFDAPHMSTAVNAYCGIPAVQEEVVRRLVGEAPFTGNSPVDPFCGTEQLRW
ncbi:glycoside hydrolase family 3 protein [Novosphingobium sp.]|uniref:glycoside hydrolase family 3 protein n=1 Tax=Novosphingobium sp. TaxID=1874826 RepID=UPI0035AEA773